MRAGAEARFHIARQALCLRRRDPQPGEHILDLGCGDGVLTEKIVERGASVVGIDNSPDMVGAARKRGLDAIPGYQFVAYDEYPGKAEILRRVNVALGER